MKRKNGRGNGCEYLDSDTVRNACNGEPSAIACVMARYAPYLKRCFVNDVAVEFGLDPELVPMEDILQQVWMKYIWIIMEQFEV